MTAIEVIKHIKKYYILFLLTTVFFGLTSMIFVNIMRDDIKYLSSSSKTIWQFQITNNLSSRENDRYYSFNDLMTDSENYLKGYSSFNLDRDILINKYADLQIEIFPLNYELIFKNNIFFKDFSSRINTTQVSELSLNNVGEIDAIQINLEHIGKLNEMTKEDFSIFIEDLNLKILSELNIINNEFKDMASDVIQNYINTNISIIKDDKNLIEKYLNFINEKNNNYFFSDARNIVFNEDFKVAKIREIYQFRNLHFNFSNTINFIIGAILGFIISFIISFNLGFNTKKHTS